MHLSRRSGRNSQSVGQNQQTTGQPQKQKEVRGQAPEQEEAGRHTKEMMANEEKVKRARMGVATDGCSRTAEDPPPPNVSRGGRGGGGRVLCTLFFGCKGERVNGPKPPTGFLPHRHEAVSALQGQGGAVCNPARGRDPLSSLYRPSFPLPARSRGQACYAQGTTGRRSVKGECEVGSGRGL